MDIGEAAFNFHQDMKPRTTRFIRIRAKDQNSMASYMHKIPYITRLKTWKETSCQLISLLRAWTMQVLMLAHMKHHLACGQTWTWDSIGETMEISMFIGKTIGNPWENGGLPT